MNTRLTLFTGFGGLLLVRLTVFTGLGGLLFVLPDVVFARVTPDVPPPQKRQTTVNTGERLSQLKPVPALPADLNSPFNPPDFEGQPSAPKASGPSAPTPVQPVKPPGDRDTLEILAAQITPTGVIQMPDRTPRLVIGSKRFEVGTRFTVSYNNQDFELELTAIERTTFTLRYRGEEVTRPIKLTR